MNSLLYMAAAVLCLGFALRAARGARRDPVRRAFVLLAGLAGVSFGAFSLYLLPGLAGLIYLHAAAGALLPAAVLGFLDRVAGDGRPSPAVRRFATISAVVAVAYLLVDRLAWDVAPRTSPPQVAIALFVLGGWVACIHRLLRERARAADRVLRARLGYMLGLLAATAAATGLEQLLRALRPLRDLATLDLFARTVVLQGAIPPVGAVVGTFFVYVLYQVAEQRRLVDLHEGFARVLAVGLAALAFVVVEGVAALWLGEPAGHPVHGTFVVFLAAAVFLAVHDPLRARLEAWIGEWINRPGRRLERALAEIEAGLTRAFDERGLERELVDRLAASGRVRQVALYLRDEERGGWRRTVARGETDRPPLDRLPEPPPFPGDDAPLSRAELALLDGEAAAAAARALEAMDADLALPVASAGRLHGWLALRSDPWTDGFSKEEVRRLAAVAARAALVLDNARTAERAAEQRRLAALGTMAAGLAHEIRNPLAGIQGAAQYLAGAPGLDDETREFIDIIVQEVQRLDRVVGQFLDYARPLRIEPVPVDLAAEAARVLDLVRAEALPPGVALALEAPEGLPRVLADPERTRQVLLNLVRNAVQAVGEEGRVRVVLGRARLERPDRRGAAAVEAAVEDDGPGVPPEHLSKLFIPFWTTRRDGTGLGLPVSRRLAEAMGGEIAVSPRPGGGSVFAVRLPVAPAR